MRQTRDSQTTSEESVTISPIVRSNRGATSIEYGVLVAGIAAVIAGVVFTLGLEVQGLYQSALDAIEAHF